MADEVVSATTVINAPAGAIFAVLAEPAKHAAIDGTGWQGAGPINLCPGWGYVSFEHEGGRAARVVVCRVVSDRSAPCTVTRTATSVARSSPACPSGTSPEGCSPTIDGTASSPSN
jgi:hypothetical protein